MRFLQAALATLILISVSSASFATCSWVKHGQKTFTYISTSKIHGSYYICQCINLAYPKYPNANQVYTYKVGKTYTDGTTMPLNPPNCSNAGSNQIITQCNTMLSYQGSLC